MPVMVLDLNDRRPAWAMPDWVPSDIRAVLPPEWELRVLETPADGSGDGMVNLDPGLLEAARDAEIYLGYGVPAALLEAAERLRWVHSGAAGVGGSLTPEMLASPVLFTNSKGIHAPPMADTALGMILHFSRGLDLGVAAKARNQWDKDSFYAGDNPLVEISHCTVGIFGFGGIGREVAKRCLALGARVLAFDRGPEAFGGGDDRFRDDAVYTGNRDDAVYTGIRDDAVYTGDRNDAEYAGNRNDAEYAGRRGGEGNRAPDADGPPAGFERVEPLHGPRGFRRLLEESDFLVLTAPETPRTRGVFDAAALARMSPRATLINISRGGLVDEGALVAA
ncbi:MAG: NAD(P)-dependent oxidoreductase, partial [Longimicrobiales bacterium]